MCQHEDMVYLGEQEALKGEKSFSLYNCQNCKSTVILKNIQENDSPQYGKTIWNNSGYSLGLLV